MNQGGNLSAGSAVGNLLGLNFRVDRNLTTGSGVGDNTIIVINPDAYTWYESSRFRLQTNVALNGQIEVEFFIVKRKLMENCDFPQKRVQLFKPTQGTAKVKAAVSLVHEFITDCFDQEGKPIDKQHKQNFSEHSCKFCPFVNRNDLCNKQ